MTAAPIVVKGMLITGVSGGEFGVVGRIEARDAKTGKMIWSRPVVEGHMGYKVRQGRQGDRERYLRHHQRDLAGRPLEDRRRGDLGRCDLRSGNQPYLRGNRQPRAVEQPRSAGRQPVLFLDRCDRPGYRQDRLALPDHAARRLGLRRSERVRLLRLQGPQYRQGHQGGGKADRNGFFFVLDRTNGKLLNAFPFVNKITWAKSIDLKDRSSGV